MTEWGISLDGFIHNHIMEGGVVDMHSLRGLQFSERMNLYEQLHQHGGGQRLVISRSPLRRLLRHLSPVDSTFRWLTAVEHPDALHIDVDSIAECVAQWTANNDGVVFLEGVNALFDAQGPVALFSLLAHLNRLSSGTNVSVFIVLDPLTFPPNVWTRISPLAPEWVNSQPEHEQSPVGGQQNPEDPHEENKLSRVRTSVSEVVLAQLVSLPENGFNSNLLSKRMLQWRRMGFDLTDMEPALKMDNMRDAYEVYSRVERTIREATDAMLELTRYPERFTVTQLERFTYRLLNLIDVKSTSKEVFAASLAD